MDTCVVILVTTNSKHMNPSEIYARCPRNKKGSETFRDEEEREKEKLVARMRV